MNKINIRFAHGLGDSALFAQATRLWTNRGYEVNVATSADKRCLFEACGCTTVDDGGEHHRYGHAPVHPPHMTADWVANKLAHNLAARPMPDIGTVGDLWLEYLKLPKPSLEPYLTPESRAEIDRFLATIDGPVVALHTRGNTSADKKNLAPELELDTYREILSRTDASLVLLDYDGRVARLSSRRVRHLTDDFRKLTVPELWYTLTRVACVVGVDSGPLHLASMWTTTPTVGVWTGHHPCHYAIPQPHVAHVVAGGDADRVSWNRRKRFAFNLVDIPELTGAVIADQVEHVLDGDHGRRLLLRNLLRKVRTFDDKMYRDRDETFAMVMDHLAEKSHPRMVETGCIRSEDDWTAGWSTFIFGAFMQHHDGCLESVDLDPTNCNFARTWTQPFSDHVTIHESDSLAWLRSYQGPKWDVVYLDSLDADVPGHAEHCLEEARLVLPHLAEDGVVLVDDSPWSKGGWTGKGRLAIPWLIDQGMKLVYSGYQALLARG